VFLQNECFEFERKYAIQAYLRGPRYEWKAARRTFTSLLAWPKSFDFGSRKMLEAQKQEWFLALSSFRTHEVASSIRELP
jgi:hypothetical protein